LAYPFDMGRLSTLARLLGLALILAAAAGSGSGAAATGPAVVRLTDRQLSDVPFGRAGRVGSGEVVSLQLYGNNGRQSIGHAYLVCWTVDKGVRSCSGSYVLPRGTIQTAGLIHSRLLYTQAIVGGTDVYDNARGTVTVTATSVKPRRELVLMRLTG
jgi:hypothetical protein